MRHGYVKDDLFYQYMTKNKDGRYLYGKVPEMDTTICVSDSDYRVESYKRQKHWLWFSDEETLYRIYVPEGCILEDNNQEYLTRQDNRRRMITYISLMSMFGVAGLMFLTFSHINMSHMDSNRMKRIIVNSIRSIGVILMVMFVILLMLFCVGSYMLKTQKWECLNKPYKVERLISLNDNAQINEKIFLRHSSVNNDACYQYKIRRNDGGCSYGQVSEANITICVSDSNYRIESYKKQRHWLWFSEEDILYKIYVPNRCIQEANTIQGEG